MVEHAELCQMVFGAFVLKDILASIAMSLMIGALMSHVNMVVNANQTLAIMNVTVQRVLLAPIVKSQ